ncbi:MAG: glycoside hydrolase family 15 protein [Thermoplasmatota archaeon]
MTGFLPAIDAFGAPGIEPRWSRGDKDGIGTAYSESSRAWFTLRHGVVTECYYPTVDRPQIRDLQFLTTDGRTFFHEERRDFQHAIRRLSPHSLGYAVRQTAPTGDYALLKEVIVDPHLPVILQRVRLEGNKDRLANLRLFALCAPHLDGGGAGNNAYVAELSGEKVLLAERNGQWLALGSSAPFARSSVGFVGASDGWTDLAQGLAMRWEFTQALRGNVALVGEIPLAANTLEFTLALAFGNASHHAMAVLLAALAEPFDAKRARFVEQWDRACRRLSPVEKVTSDGGNLYRASFSVLMAHEDKSYPGAITASLSIPWGSARGDDDRGGYHLVWTRDLFHIATGLLAAGNEDTPSRILLFMAASQNPDGGFYQNFWLDGTPYRKGVQLDEVAFPILLAYHCKRTSAIAGFDPYPLVLRAAAYLVHNGPATEQERWEEVGGFSPSTLASNIAALVCAADFARERGDAATASFLEEYADFLESNVEKWTTTNRGTLVEGVASHFLRINPDSEGSGDPGDALVTIANLPPSERSVFLAKEIVDAGFLELVRYGIRAPNAPIVVASLRVVDATLKVETPAGPVWHRYSHDGYGETQDGGPFQGSGKGRAWPLLTGERGHYELAAGRDARPYLRALEEFAAPTGLLPEQVWDEDPPPSGHLQRGRPTGGARPLNWAHAEYLKLARSIADGHVFDRISIVAQRYLRQHPPRNGKEIWKFNHQRQSVGAGATLRIIAGASFRLHFSLDCWSTAEDREAITIPLGVSYVDIPVPRDAEQPIRFTFFWTATERWEGRDFEVTIQGA